MDLKSQGQQLLVFSGCWSLSIPLIFSEKRMLGTSYEPLITILKINYALEKGTK
jgi:hypothetical protein